MPNQKKSKAKLRAAKSKTAPTICVFTGVADTLEAAIETAHRKIPPRPGQDFAVSRVINFGMQTGGFVQVTQFYVELAEDEFAPLRSSS